jgi:hypothetical protein
LVIVAVVVVLAVGAVAQIGRASGPDRRTVDRSFAALATPIVTQSNASGSALSTLLRRGPSLARTTLLSDLSSLAAATTEDDRQFAALTPPVPQGDVATLCGTTMRGRRRAATQVRAALDGLLGGPRGLGGGDEAAAARALGGVGTLLESADASWAACRRSLRRASGSARLPASVWVTHPGAWGPVALGQLVAALESSASLAPVHRLDLVAVSTDPVAVPGASGESVLPPTSTLRVRVVLVDRGNVDEARVSLVVTATPQGTFPAPAPVRAATGIGAGRSVALSPPALSVRPGRSYVLDVTATAPTGASASISVPVRVSVVPPSPTSTTTTTATTTTTTTSTTTHPG